MTDARVTQASLELWAQGTPNAIATQISVEVWGSSTALSTQALLTVVAVEQWAATGLAPVGGASAMAMILA